MIFTLLILFFAENVILEYLYREQVFQKQYTALLDDCRANTAAAGDECLTINYHPYLGCVYSFDANCLVQRQCVRLLNARTDDCVYTVGYTRGNHSCTLIRNWDCERERRAREHV
jgi:hypothetical protein